MAPDLSPVHADCTRLKQCLLNLLSNACKFTKAGEVDFSITQEQVMARSSSHSASPTPASDSLTTRRRRLFQPFSQADASTTRKFGGTGLGLAITKICAKQWAAASTCKANPCRFDIYDPLARRHLKNDVCRLSAPPVITSKSTGLASANVASGVRTKPCMSRSGGTNIGNGCFVAGIGWSPQQGGFKANSSLIDERIRRNLLHMLPERTILMLLMFATAGSRLRRRPAA